MVSISTQAVPNSSINFQGKIVNLADGTNLATGSPSCIAAGADTCDLRASIYTDSAGGTLLWQETHNNVELGDYEGVFNLQLNSICNDWATPSVPCSGSGIDWGADSTVYLEIQFDDDGNGDFVSPEVFSRSLFNSVPYAYEAGSISGGLDTVYDNDSDKVLGIDDAAGLIFDLVTTGDFVISENGTPFFTFSPDNQVTYSPDDATDVFDIAIGNFRIGTGGTPGLALDGEDAYIEGTLEVDSAVDFGSDVDFNNNEAIAFRTENADGSASVPTCDSSTAGRHYYDTYDDNAYVCVEQSPSVYGWFDYTASITSTSTKVVTVGTGGDYASISTAAGYLNGLTGGIILLTPEIHNVTTSVDLENITLIGANTGDTIIDISGGGQLEVKETQFKSLTIDIDAALTAAYGLDAKYDASTTSSIIFEWVDFQINGTKFLIDSSAGTAPTIRTRFISPSTTSGNRDVIDTTSGANISGSSEHFIESQGGIGTLDFQDWNVTVSGSANVTTSGNVETIPSATIFVYPGMNLQGAVDSLTGGGVITLLPGTHSITSTLLIDNDNIQIIGYGDSSIITASGFTGIGTTTAAIQIGAANGTAPNDNVILSDFRLEVSGSDIHGIRAAGGDDIQLYNVTVVKTSGAASNGANAKIGIHFIDGTSADLVRPVIQNCRVFGNSAAGAYFTDGIHVTSDGTITGVFGNGNNVINALVDGNNVDYVRETAAVFVGVDDSSLFNNRFSRMGAGGGGAYGVYVGNSRRINFTANTVSGSLSTTSTAIGVESFNVGALKETVNSVFASNTIDGEANGGVGFGTVFQIGATANTGVHRNNFDGNIIAGASSGTTVGFDVRGNADNNSFSSNSFDGGTNPWDTGVNLQASTQNNNVIRGNRYNNVTVELVDAGADTKLGVAQHRDTANPTVNDDNTLGYRVGTIWINTTSDTTYISVDSSTGAAVWNQIDAGGGGSTDLDGAYDSDADKVLNVDNASGLEFISSTSGNIIFDMQSTGDFIIEDTGSNLFTVLDGGNVGIGTATPQAALDINVAGTAAAASLIWQSDTDTGFFHPGANILGVTAGGAEQLRITGNGLRFASKVANPGTPVDGDIWFRSDTDNLMFRADNRTQELQAVAVAQVYQSGTTTFTTTPGAITFNGTSANQRIIDATYTHSTATNPSRLTINDTGLYKINYNISWDTTANSRRTTMCELRINGAAPTPVLGRSYAYSRNNTDDLSTNTATVMYSLTATNYIEVYCSETGSTGGTTTLANQSWLSIELVRRQ